jgi:hypothetical protein
MPPVPAARPVSAGMVRQWLTRYGHGHLNSRIGQKPQHRTTAIRRPMPHVTRAQRPAAPAANLATALRAGRISFEFRRLALALGGKLWQ